MFREAGTQVSPVAMSCPSLLCPVCCYKRPLKEEKVLFAWLFAFVLGKKLLLWAFWCGKLLEGKRIVEGKKELLKGKEGLIKVYNQEL
jgi:hypothetical protein